MREVFDRAWKALSKIAFMLSPDIERLLDKECQVCFNRQNYISVNAEICCI